MNIFLLLLLFLSLFPSLLLSFLFHYLGVSAEVWTLCGPFLQVTLPLSLPLLLPWYVTFFHYLAWWFHRTDLDLALSKSSLLLYSYPCIIPLLFPIYHPSCLPHSLLPSFPPSLLPSLPLTLQSSLPLSLPSSLPPFLPLSHPTFLLLSFSPSLSCLLTIQAMNSWTYDYMSEIMVCILNYLSKVRPT